MGRLHTAVEDHQLRRIVEGEGRRIGRMEAVRVGPGIDYIVQVLGVVGHSPAVVDFQKWAVVVDTAAAADPKAVVDHTAAAAAVVAVRTEFALAVHTALAVVDIGFRMLQAIGVDMGIGLAREAVLGAVCCIPIAIEGMGTVCHMGSGSAQESREPELKRWGTAGVQEDSVVMELSSAGTR